MSKEWEKKRIKRTEIQTSCQFITDSLRQYTFMCGKEDKYAFNQFLYCYYYHDYYLVNKASHFSTRKRCEEI